MSVVPVYTHLLGMSFGLLGIWSCLVVCSSTYGVTGVVIGFRGVAGFVKVVVFY